MNPNLLALVEMPTKRVPVMLDRIPASEADGAGPFLITSSKALMWVERAFRGGFLRLGVRQTSPHDLFRGLVESVAERGSERGWGNVQPCSKEGMLEGLAHLHYYELSDPVLLYGSDFDISIAPEGRPFRVPADWLPPTWVVLIPSDREFVGTSFLFREGHVGAVIHNASRGIVVLKGGGSGTGPVE